MRTCPYCGRTNCIWANQAPGTPVPAGVPVVDTSSGFGALTAKDWLGGLVACAQGFLAGAATGAYVGSTAAAATYGISALAGALIGGAIGCVTGIGAYALSQFVANETAKQQEEFARQQSAQFQAEIAQQQAQLESGLSGGVSKMPVWVIPAALAIVGVGFLSRKKKATT